MISANGAALLLILALSSTDDMAVLAPMALVSANIGAISVDIGACPSDLPS